MGRYKGQRCLLPVPHLVGSLSVGGCKNQQFWLPTKGFLLFGYDYVFIFSVGFKGNRYWTYCIFPGDEHANGGCRVYTGTTRPAGFLEQAPVQLSFQPGATCGGSAGSGRRFLAWNEHGCLKLCPRRVQVDYFKLLGLDWVRQILGAIYWRGSKSSHRKTVF